MKNKNYIVEYQGEPVTRLSFDALQRIADMNFSCACSEVDRAMSATREVIRKIESATVTKKL